MKEHIYTARKSSIIRQSAPIWIYVLIQLVLNIAWDPRLVKEHHIERIIYFNIFLCLVTVPGIILFIKYYRQSAGKEFIIRYHSVIYRDIKTGAYTELVNTAISKVTLIEKYRGDPSPWTFLSYFSLEDAEGKKIIVTSFFLDIGDFWMDTLSRRVKRSGLERVTKFYPFF